ncbi:U-box domain-containing protein 21 [Sesamum angolense]|uniref:U-box domain-containing protein n=1 Tax=Sesamum angolense TaxID=2727404 RepID=A0AAE1T6U4_9LAMI|nr:U-box domain-containing protein 21 [Sesamum angolense]
MTFSWRRRRSGRGGDGKSEVFKGINQDMELTIPTHFRCPISLDLMKDPVTLSTGITYDRESIEKWIDAGNITCPVTNQVLRNFDQIPNHSIRKMIQDWCVENKSCGVERIPTPRIPITPYEVTDIRSRIVAAARVGDARKCQELVGKIKDLAKESERNRRCIVGNGIGSALADSFESFARFSVDAHVNLLKEILAAFTWTFPLDEEGISKLKSAVSLRCMVWFLKSENDLSSRQNAICVLKELISADQACVDGLMGIQDIEETLFHTVKVPICPKATKASLVIIYNMIKSSKEKSGEIALKFIRMGLIHLILEILVDGDKSVCEKALGVMDSICSLEEGRENAYENALTVPLLVKKILRVSDTATEFSISSLCKLCLGENESALVEAMQLGAFQKLLVVLQIGSGERTKEKVTELLKLMNLCRDKVDCVDASMGFKYIKRSN